VLEHGRAGLALRLELSIQDKQWRGTIVAILDSFCAAAAVNGRVNVLRRRTRGKEQVCPPPVNFLLSHGRPPGLFLQQPHPCVGPPPTALTELGFQGIGLLTQGLHILQARLHACQKSGAATGDLLRWRLLGRRAGVEQGQGRGRRCLFRHHFLIVLMELLMCLCMIKWV